jgi:hypothetical protein
LTQFSYPFIPLRALVLLSHLQKILVFWIGPGRIDYKPRHRSSMHPQDFPLRGSNRCNKQASCRALHFVNNGKYAFASSSSHISRQAASCPFSNVARA